MNPVEQNADRLWLQTVDQADRDGRILDNAACALGLWDTGAEPVDSTTGDPSFGLIDYTVVCRGMRIDHMLQDLRCLIHFLEQQKKVGAK